MYKWYESESCNSGIIIGGQICLVRNIEDYPFENQISMADQKALLEMVCYAVRETEQILQMKFQFMNLAVMKAYERAALVARLAIPPHMLTEDHEAGLLLSEDESVSILVNGREHLCIQVSCPGANIALAAKLASDVDNCLNQHLRYAFSNKYGYLTASPLFTGTGMRASYLMHLPYIEKKGKIHQLEKGLVQYGVSLRAHFQGEVQAPGGIYRLQNRKTLGLSETEIISEVEDLAGQLAVQEQKMGIQMIRTNRLEEEDTMYRSYGILKYARNLAYDETMECLSSIHAGDLYGIWHEDRKIADFGMMIGVDEHVLASNMKSEVDQREMGSVRAAYIRDHLISISPDTISH